VGAADRVQALRERGDLGYALLMTRSRHLARRLLSPVQYERAAAAKRRSLSLVEDALRRVAAALPARGRLALRDGSSVVERLDYPRADIRLAVDSDVERRLRGASCAKEPRTVQWIEEVFRPGDVFYDIGANVGAYALVAAKAHAGAVRVYAFEPSFATYAQLCRNVILNGCSGTITALPVALADRTALQTLHYRDLRAGMARHALAAPVDADGRAFEAMASQAVLGYSLDDLVTHLALPVPTHIKLDVDGFEAEVLAGAGKTLGDPALRTVLIELMDDTDAERTCMAILCAVGFRVRSRERYEIRAGGSVSAHNYVFERTSSLA
jgi:FkbM family methyltransferase